MAFFTFAVVKKPFEIKALWSYLSVPALVLLLLISPCKVRHSIQSELGVPPSEVLNKSQSAVHQLSCLSLEFLESALANSPTTSQQPDGFISNFYQFDFNNPRQAPSSSPALAQNKVARDVPFYILYRNLRAYL
ncbi:hypothetical protein [Carboxylicivirga taeanensis]|uniref:hypothetical protein n=1 Tax=Carboxylicivirga taeanensis TaxID=1416875 RepID=UPI003F6E0594